MKCAINEIFGPTIQGEGLFNGVPSIFVRFNGCNLRCCFKGGSICDTAYTSHRPEEAKYSTTEEAAKVVNELLDKYPNVTDIVFTGGEPMLQQEAIVDLITLLPGDLCYTVETNGTIPVIDELSNLIDLWSISPKLRNSCSFEGHDIPKRARYAHIKRRINYDAIASFKDKVAQLKFVYTDDSTEQEIENWLMGLIESHPEMQFQDCPVLIMPEGEVEEQINKSSEAAIRACIKHGWRFCDRVHIRIWGNKRAV